MTNFSTRQITNALRGANSDEGNLKPNTVLQDRYLILGVLGIGGMGAVYQARDLRFPSVTKLVAVKEMINLVPDPALRTMIIRNFEREGNLLATLNHPAIPKIYDLFNHDEHSYLVMEYIEGKDLEAVLNNSQGFLEETQVVEWAIQLCDVLTYLHAHQPEPIVFRDMKPSNVMLDQHENVRLIDFGIAKGFQAGQKGTMIGTEGYSPPEQYRGEAGPSGDLYALGATLHHLLTKRDPRLEPPFSFAERPLRKINPAVSAELEQIINASLAYSPQDRFPSAAAMKQALINLRRGTAVIAPPTQPPPAAAPGGSGATTILPNVPSPAATAVVSQQVAAALSQASGGIIPLWVFKCEDEIRSQPLPAGKYVYVSVYDNNLYAVSRAEGKFVWKYAAEGGFAASPVFDGGSVYIGSEDNKLYALNSDSGRMLWNYETKEPVRCTARVAQGHVFVGSDDGYLHAVNAQAGRGVWRFNAAAPVRSRPAVLEKEARVFFGCESGEFYCLDFTGEQKWKRSTKRAVMSSAIIVEGLVVFGSTDASIYALEANTGWPAWKTRTQKGIVSSPSANERAVFIGSADGNLYAVDIRSGRVLWKFETEDQIASSPVVYKGGVYFGSVDEYIYCVEAKDGKLRWKFKTDGPVISSPSVVEDVVYIGSADRTLYALAA